MAHQELAKAQEDLALEGKTQAALGSGPFFAAQIVPQAVMRLRDKFPDVQLRLVEGLQHATGTDGARRDTGQSLAPRPPQGLDDPSIRFKPIAHLSQIVVVRRGHPLAKSRTAAALASAEWLCSLRRDAAAAALRARRPGPCPAGGRQPRSG